MTNPYPLETHAGNGKLWEAVYADLDHGIALEIDNAKCERLANQRPNWCVLQCDAIDALMAGAGSHAPVNLLDIDPYGDPWPVIEAFFGSERPFPDPMVVVVNDGLRQKLKLGDGGAVKSMRAAAAEIGSAKLSERYLDVCRWNLARIVRRRGYEIAEWTAYHCGKSNGMTHYAAVLRHA